MRHGCVVVSSCHLCIKRPCETHLGNEEAPTLCLLSKPSNIVVVSCQVIEKICHKYTNIIHCEHKLTEV